MIKSLILSIIGIILFAYAGFVYGQDIFVTQSDNFNGSYTFKSYISYKTPRTSYQDLQDNMTSYTDMCIQNLTGVAKEKDANGILSLRWNTQSYETKYVFLECSGMAIKINTHN